MHTKAFIAATLASTIFAAPVPEPAPQDLVPTLGETLTAPDGVLPSVLGLLGLDIPSSKEKRQLLNGMR
jgi:hypothetical protein